MNKIDFSLNKENINEECNKLLNKAIKYQKIELNKSNLSRASSLMGINQNEIINNHECEIFTIDNIKFIEKYRNKHVKPEKRKKIVSETSLNYLLTQMKKVWFFIFFISSKILNVTIL